MASATPKAIMMAIIFLGGVFRSLQFTALNTIGFAEIDSPLMSQATSFSQMAQRLALSLGVAISAFVLHWTAGDATVLPVHSFASAFLVIAVLSTISVVSFVGLSGDGTVTLRDRDTLEQERVPLDGVRALLLDRLEAPWHPRA